jgi:hypothetical protein
MKLLLSLSLFSIISFQSSFCQTSSGNNRDTFFKDTSVINATLTVDMGKVFRHSKHGDIFYGNFSTVLPDGSKVNDPVQLQIRGHFRQEFCYVPPIKLKFSYKDSARFAFLKSLKLVSECKVSPDHDQLLLKEFLIYKIYNLLTGLSFHARLLNLTFQDSTAKKKPFTEHAFLLEDIGDVGKRNDCLEWKKGGVNTEATDRRQMTMVALFEYMIGNTDWAVSVEHNIRLIVSAKDSSSKPVAVPYDFDYSGLVNTYYAIPDEKLEIENVTTRVYRGYPRTMPELQQALDTFRLMKKDIYSLINNFSLLDTRNKQSMTGYLDGFYSEINNPDIVKNVFIDHARTQ